MEGAAMGTAFRHLRGLLGGGSVVTLEDGQLLARYGLDGDEAAFEALIGRHGPMVLTICRVVLKNEHDVEDAFQATFLVLAKKARSIQGADTLGGWLHRVAYRASVQASVERARRRRKEADAAMARRDAMGPERGSDLAALLHEEIDRLPEGQRLPVVLCDLEGLTYEEAARQLRWTVPTLRNRLARARQRLKGRLARRGMIAPVIVASSATVPPSLARMALSAAIGGPASAGAAVLTHSLLRGMLMTKIKIAGTATLAALALASASLIAAGAGKPEDPKPAMKPKAEAARPEPEPAVRKPGETVEVKGQVVDPDGKPVAGATVRGASYADDATAYREATSGPDGRFALRLPKLGPELLEMEGGYPLVASSPGHGVGVTEWTSGPDPVVRLAPEGPPIEGRVIDLEGRAVVGAQVRVNSFYYDQEKGDFPAWIGRLRKNEVGNPWDGLYPRNLEGLAEVQAKTGPDGRFRLLGIGRDRLAELVVSGPRIATTQAYVFSRDEPEFRSQDQDRRMMGQFPLVVHAPRFELALPPSRRVEGVARDQDTGRPIAGLKIEGFFDENSLLRIPGNEATTDAEGRYRLDGLARAGAYVLMVESGKGLPYPNANLKVAANGSAVEPVAFDFALRRGIVLRGRVTDKVTGRPIYGASVTYHPFAANLNIGQYPGFEEAQAPSAFADEDGHFEVVALPGRGLIDVDAQSGRYLPAAGFEQIPGYDPKEMSFLTLPDEVFPVTSNALAEVVVEPKAVPITLNFLLDPGRSATVEVVDPDGKPLGGTKTRGLSAMFTTAIPQESDRIEVYALDPGKPRRVVVTHEGRKLVGSALLKGDEAGPVRVKLELWGSVAGRIVFDEGQPRKGLFVIASGDSTNEHLWINWNTNIRVGDDGRFVVEGLVPGLRYAASVGAAFEVVGDLFQGVTVATGEARDLGDLRVKPLKP